MNQRQKETVCKILNAIGSWSPGRFDQWLRYHVGDEDADEILAWLDHEDADEILAWLDRNAHIGFDTTDKVFKVRS